jgi:uncharacterized membrane protein YphA (DoxX/SURF4 family)
LSCTGRSVLLRFDFAVPPGDSGELPIVSVFLRVVAVLPHVVPVLLLTGFLLLLVCLFLLHAAPVVPLVVCISRHYSFVELADVVVT